MNGFIYYFRKTDAVPELLICSINSSLRVFNKIYVVTSHEIAHPLKRHPEYIKGRLIIKEINEDEVYGNSVVKKYMDFIEKGLIKSNSPGTEIHCIYRWIAMHNLFLVEKVKTLVMLDWDTFVFEFPKLDFDQYDFIYAETNDRERLPSWHICPHLMLLRQNILEMYLDYFDKTLEKRKKETDNYFCDMETWSHVISKCYTQKEPKRFKYSTWQELVHSSNYIYDGNIRLEKDLGTIYSRTKYLIPKDHPLNFTGDEFLEIKTIKCLNESSQPYLLAIKKMHGVENNETDYKYYKAISLHFSGTEAKIILFTHLHWLRNYLLTLY